MEVRRRSIESKEKREMLEISARFLYEHVWSHWIVLNIIEIECDFGGEREKLFNILQDSKSPTSIVSSSSIRDYRSQAVNRLYGELGRCFSLSSSRLQFALWQLDQLLNKFSPVEWERAIASKDHSMAMSFALIQKAAAEGSSAAGRFLDMAREMDPELDRKGVTTEEAKRLIERQERREDLMTR